MPLDNEIRFLGDMQKLTLGPDDVFVLTCESHLSSDAFESIREHFEKQFPRHKCIVLCGGMKLGVVEKAA